MLSDKDIVVYALYILGGWHQRVHTEDIALKCYELTPSKFSWVKYPQYPDLAPARFALESAKKQKYGALVKGGSERKKSVKSLGGWMLTYNGIQWIRDNEKRIEKFLGKLGYISDRLPAHRKLIELFKSTAYKKFIAHIEKAEITHAEFAESFLCTVNTRSEVLSDRLEQLYSIAEELGEEKVKNYINFCRKRFESILTNIREGKNVKS